MGAQDERWTEYAKRVSTNYEKAREEYEATLEKGRMYTQQEYYGGFYAWLDDQIKKHPRPSDGTNPENWA